MKKIALIAAFIFAALTTYAQEGFRFGFRLSPLVTSVRITDQDNKLYTAADQGGRAGISAGLIGIYGFSEKVGLYTGLLFTSKGMAYYYKNGNDKMKYSTTLTTLEIPIALHLLSNEVMDGMKIRGLFGLQNNILIGVSNVTPKDTDKSRDGYTFFVPDLLIGVGVEWALPKIGTLDLGVSYHHPLGSYYKTSYDLLGKSYENRYKMSYVAIDLAYIF
jgi:hypothetical protein